MRHRVLVVEDEEDIAFPLVRTLEREGYEVAWVDSGQRALDELAGRSAEVVILDLGLPDMDGLEVCKQARAAGFEGATSRLRIDLTLTTSDATAETDAVSVTAGADRVRGVLAALGGRAELLPVGLGLRVHLPRR